MLQLDHIFVELYGKVKYLLKLESKNPTDKFLRASPELNVFQIVTVHQPV